MKKWICKLLCLSMLVGIGDIPANAMVEQKEAVPAVQNTDTFTLREVQKPVAESPTVETGAVETASPSAAPTQAPVFTGNKVVNSEDVFVVTENSADKSCVITGYKGDTGVTTLYIPEEIKGKTVQSVDEAAFASCAFLKNVVVYGDAEFKGVSAFTPASGIEIWGVTGSKASVYAAARGLVFHVIDGPATVSGKKAVSLNRATLTWSAVGGAVSYNIYRKKGKGQYALYTNRTVTSFTNEKLTPGSVYTFKVSSVFMASNGDMIEGVSSKGAAVSLKPAKVKKLRAKGVRGGIQVRWKRDKNVNGYQVYMKVHVKGFKTNFARVKTIKKNKTTGYRCKMLVRGMKYSYKVRSFKKVKGKTIYGPFVTVTAKAK